jgi:hypothetical protein
MLGQNVTRWPIFVPIAAIVVSIACIAHESFALPEIFVMPELGSLVPKI